MTRWASRHGFSGAAGGAVVNNFPAGGTIAASGYYDNLGAVVLTTFPVLPTQGIVATLKRVASFEVELAPPAGKQIYWSGDPTGATADKKLRLTTDGDVVDFVVDANGDVQVTSEFGGIVLEV